jgi:hypothetical protein
MYCLMLVLQDTQDRSDVQGSASAQVHGALEIVEELYEMQEMQEI